jgi:hypothetical protein
MKNAVFWDVALQTPAHAGSSLSDFSALKMKVPKRRFTEELHGAISQKTAFFKGSLNRP